MKGYKLNVIRHPKKTKERLKYKKLKYHRMRACLSYLCYVSLLLVCNSY